MMQVVGTKPFREIAEQVAHRAEIPAVREWALKSVQRHLRRSEDYLVPVDDHRVLSRMMAADGVPTEAAQRIMVAYKGGEKVFTPARDIKRRFLTQAFDAMDWINSLDVDDRRIRRIDRMSWGEAVAQSEAWHQALTNVRRISGDLLSGTRKLMDLDDGAFAVELESGDALRTEGAQMGHCVGGYWAKVKSGRTRIVSIRDAGGRPHVTIELGTPPVVEVHGLGRITVAQVPRNGVEHIVETQKDWRAVQVRGKQNAVPVSKWLKRTWAFLTANGMAWADNGYGAADVSAPEGAPLVFTVDGVHYSDAAEAMRKGEESVLEGVRKGQALKSAYERSGLVEIHEHLSVVVPGAREDFLNSAMPVCLERMKRLAGKGTGGGLQSAMRESGVAYVMKELALLSPESTIRQRAEFMRMVIADDPKEVETSSMPMVSVPGARGLDVVVHKIPLTALTLLAGGVVQGVEMEAIEHLRPYLSTVIARIEDNPIAIHAIVPAEGGAVQREDVHKAFLVCGLAAEYARAAIAVDAGVKGARGGLVHSLKQARAKGGIEVGEYNRFLNLLSEGYETRILMAASDLVRGVPFLIGAAPSRAAPRPVLRRDEPLMLYRGEGRAPIAASVRTR